MKKRGKKIVLLFKCLIYNHSLTERIQFRDVINKRKMVKADGVIKEYSERRKKKKKRIPLMTENMKYMYVLYIIIVSVSDFKNWKVKSYCQN